MEEQKKRRVVKSEDKSQNLPKYESTPDSLFAAKQNYDSAEDDFLNFVKKQLDDMHNKLLFNTTPSFQEINDSLASYESILFTLMSSYAGARIEAATAKEVYEDEWANCIVQTKQDLGLQKYVSGKELEYITRTRFMEKLSKLKANQIAAEHKLALMNHLTEAWRNFQYVLSTLSKNAQAEVNASRISTNDRVGEYLGDTPE